MKTNDLKKETKVKLRCGWLATLKDNMRGNIRVAEVNGIYKELGSIYAHDIVEYMNKSGQWMSDIVLTKSQKQCMDMVEGI